MIMNLTNLTWKEVDPRPVSGLKDIEKKQPKIRGYLKVSENFLGCHLKDDEKNPTILSC